MLRILAGFLLTLLAVTSAMAQSGYGVRPGDVLQIEVLEDPSLNGTPLVLPDGSVSIPLVGSVAVGGRTVDEVRDDITARLAGNFAVPPTVFVSVRSLATREQAVVSEAPSIGVFLMGESANPGRIQVEPGSTLLQVLAQSGGFGDFAAKKRIQLRRGSDVYIFNYNEIEKLGGAGFQTVVAEGDVIVIPTRRLFE